MSFLRFLCVPVICALLPQQPVFAANATGYEVSADSRAQGRTASGVQPIDALPSGAVVDNDAPREAKLWGLSLEEFERYRELSVVDRHFSAENITPYEVLGKYATSQRDQLRYAEMYRDKMMENQIRALEWWASVNAVVDPTDTDFLKGYTPNTDREVAAMMQDAQAHELAKWGRDNPGQSSTVRRAYFFVDATCTKDCQTEFEKAKALIDDNTLAGIDVVFKGMDVADRDQVTAWAVSQKIGVEEVRERTITLNHDTAAYRELRAPQPDAVLIDAAGQVIPL